MPDHRLTAVLAISFAAVLGACDVAPQAEIPAQLVGRYVSDAPAYAGRYLELASGSVVFGQGERYDERHLVYRFDAQPAQDGMHYTISYVDGAGEYRMKLIGSPGPQGGQVLRFENRPSVSWHLERVQTVKPPPRPNSPPPSSNPYRPPQRRNLPPEPLQP